jgi:hypothetical protein
MHLEIVFEIRKIDSDRYVSKRGQPFVSLNIESPSVGFNMVLELTRRRIVDDFDRMFHQDPEERIKQYQSIVSMTFSEGFTRETKSAEECINKEHQPGLPCTSC